MTIVGPDPGLEVHTPHGEEAEETALTAAWKVRPGITGWLAAVNHKQVGRRFIFTALAFLFIGGAEAMVMRAQLARPDSALVGPEGYNELFTMHGTTMLFLFAVPLLEGLAMLVLPMMLGTRDMPFPRLNAFGYWAYLFGGVLVYASVLTGDVPAAGWFAYVPLAGPEFSPGKGLDYWLLGITFVEISGIVGAIELLVLLLRHRAPGMSLARVPLFCWAVGAMAAMMLFAFPTVVAASTLLELERNFDLPFFDPGRGGEPLLWQHLFWIFGHPEVYIMFLPAAGIVSTVIPTFARRPMIGYRWLVVAFVTIAFTSFGLWVHHMFTVGIPMLALSFFTAASMLVAIPSGIQVFAWIATIWDGVVEWTTSMLYVVGFLAIFVLGGITGVMVAVVPFDWQVHDSYFVVAHFHYVLVGGVVFPIVAGLHYWWPKIAGRMLDERLGKVAFWLQFVGFNVAFFPQHILGLAGMPRRVYTYRSGDGWAALNLVSTAGSFVLGLGFLVLAVNMVRSARTPAAPSDPWGAPTLEWATASPPRPYNFATLPVVASAEPRWEPAVATGDVATLQAELRDVDPRSRRETWGTTVIDADVEELVLVAQPSLFPLAAALGIAVALVGVLADSGWLQLLGGVATVVSLVLWLWPTRPELHGEPRHPSEQLRQPAPTRRPDTTISGVYGLLLAALPVLTIVAAIVFAYLRLLSTAPQWPPGGADAPGWLAPLLAAVALVVATGCALRATAAARADRGAWARSLVGGGGVAGVVAGAFVLPVLTGLEVAPSEHAYGAATATALGAGLALIAVGVAISAVVVAGAVHRAWPRPLVATRLVAIWWGLTLLSWSVLAATIVAVPRLLWAAPVAHSEAAVRDEVGGPEVARQLFGLLAAPLAWVGHLVVGLSLVPVACETGQEWPLHATTLATAALAGAGIAVARGQRPAPGASGRAVERERLLSDAGWVVGVLFLALILVEGAPVLFLEPCG